jgi:hypothetical protein
MSMTQEAPESEGDWSEANRHFLVAKLDRLRRQLRLKAQGAGQTGRAPQGEAEADDPAGLEAAMRRPPALRRIAETFGLTAFEQDVLMLCAGVELAADIAALCGEAQGEPERPFPTFGLALAAFADPTWSALLPTAPLRFWRMVRRDEPSGLTTGRLSIDERMLHALLGLDPVDGRIAALLSPPPPAATLFPSETALAERMAAAWRAAEPPWPVLQLAGRTARSRWALAASACGALGWELLAIPAAALPAAEPDLAETARLAEREFVLASRVIYIDGAATNMDAADRLIETMATPVIVGTPERRPPPMRAAFAFDAPLPDAQERRDLWFARLGARPEEAPALDLAVDKASSHFRLTEAQIAAVCAELGGEDPAPGLWRACREQARPRIDDLATRIEAHVGWDDLILPERQKEQLRELERNVAHRFTVYQRWGFAGSGERGLGVAALFAGGSGTGKTLAAEVLAGALDLDLYRIDLSAVTSKYIGETEKHLRRLFDEAEESGAILLFDEADALFGKRSEVRDSHDRFANIEISYLLQRIENYAGLAILTTNMKEALDGAFLRRLRFVVDFPFPDKAQRLEMWRRAFPEATPTEGLRPEALAGLNVSGGMIRSIALGAAFLAASEGGPVTMARIAAAAKAACARMGRPLSETEVRGLQT